MPKTEEKVDSAIHADNNKSAEWWGSMDDFEIRGDGSNNVFQFEFDQTVFQKKSINASDKNWSDPVMVAESMDDLTEILNGCLKDREENKYVNEAVDYYFKQKTEEFGKIYPATTAPDFFDHHVIMTVFSRPQESCWYVSQAKLKETEEGALQVVLDLANYFPYEGMMERSQSLKFYWIARGTWEKHKDVSIEFDVSLISQPEWIHFENYLYENKATGEVFHFILRKNPYDEVPLACSVYFGKTYATKSRLRFLDYYVKAGYENDSTLRAQAERCTFYYPAFKENGVLTVNQCAYKQSENADTLATHIFRERNGKLIYDAKSSPTEIAGLPDGAVFTLKEYKK